MSMLTHFVCLCRYALAIGLGFRVLHSLRPRRVQARDVRAQLSRGRRPLADAPRCQAAQADRGCGVPTGRWARGELDRRLNE